MAVIDSEIEGPVSGVPVLNAAGDVVTMTVNGVPVRVPATVLDPDTGLPVPMPIHTPTGATGNSTSEVAMLRRSSRPSQPYGIHLARLMTKKKNAIVAANFKGARRIGMM